MTSVTTRRRDRCAIIMDHLTQCPGLTAGQLGQITGADHTSVMRDLRDMAARGAVCASAEGTLAGQTLKAWYPAAGGGPAGPLTAEQRKQTRDYTSTASRKRRQSGTPGLKPLPGGAACTGADLAVFFPEDDDDSQAKAICARCPIRDACYKRAVAQGERFGIWGGENFATRVRRPRRRTRPADPEPGPAMALRDLPPMDKAARLAELRGEHHTINATARAASLDPTTIRFYLDLLELDTGTQERVRTGALSPSRAVAAVRNARTGKQTKRATS